MKVNKLSSSRTGVLLLLLVALTVNGQNLPNSFRHHATGGALLDDLDLVYDPIELSFVTGVRLYTNLANIISTREMIFNNVSNNTFLVGLSGPIPRLSRIRTSVLWQFQNATTPMRVSIDSNLDGLPDQFGDGALVDDFSRYFDTDNDGFYDRKSHINQEAHNNTSDNMQQLVLTTSMPIGSCLVGARLNVGKTISDNVNANFSMGSGQVPIFRGVRPGDPTFGVAITNQDLTDGFVLNTNSENGNFFEEEKSSFFDLTLSAMKNLYLLFGKTEGRLDLKLAKITSETSYQARYTARQDRFERDLAVYEDYYQESEQKSTVLTDAAMRLGIAVDLKRVFHQARDRRHDGCWRLRLDLDRISGDYDNATDNKFSSHKHFFDGIDTLRLDESIQDDIISGEHDKGDVGGYNLAVTGLANIPFNDRIAMGMGVYWTLTATKRETKFDILSSDFYQRDLLDTLATVDDRKTTITSARTADRTYESTISSFMVPVGLEVAFTDSLNWKFRLGARFSYSKVIVNDASQITGSFPETTQFETGAGTVTVNVAENAYSSTSRHSETFQTETAFFYGLGYQPIENLQFDVLGFLGTMNNSLLDAEFYRQLRLSVTFHF